MVCMYDAWEYFEGDGFCMAYGKPKILRRAHYIKEIYVHKAI